MRMILTFTPAGIEPFFEETLQRALDPSMDPPEPPDVIAARYVAAAPRYGLEFAPGTQDTTTPRGRHRNVRAAGQRARFR